MNFNKIKTIIFIIMIISCLLSSCENFSNQSDYFEDDSIRWYFLENPTPREKAEKMLFLKMYNDDEIRFGVSGISSYSMIKTCKYLIENDELIIKYEDDDEIIAVFTVADENNTFIFKESSIPLFADVGARYVFTPSWISLNENKITIYEENIPGIDVFRYINRESYQWDITGKNKINKFSKWTENLILEKAVFDEGYSPGDIEVSDVYLLRTSFGGMLFEYGKYNDGEYYIHFDNEWYCVKNPSPPPLA